MLGQVGPSPYDLYFPLGPIPVRVTPWFWLAGVLTGFSALQMNPPRPDLLLVWIGCLFVSILVHEMGHALVGLAFGWPSRVFLYHFGGVAQFDYQPQWTTGKSVAVSFAGPWFGFLLYGLVRLAEWLLYRDPAAIPAWAYDDRIREAFRQLEWINLWWGLINLLPVYPLDGGHISATLLEHYRGRGGQEWACKLSIGVAAVAALALFRLGSQFGGILFLLLAIDNYQRLEMFRRGYW